MKEYFKVIKINNGLITASVVTDGCGGCEKSVGCGIKGKKQNEVIIQEPPLHTIGHGDVITVEIPTMYILKEAFMLYMLPLIVMLLAAGSTGSEKNQILFAITGLFCTIIFNVIRLRKLDRNKVSGQIIQPLGLVSLTSDG